MNKKMNVEQVMRAITALVCLLAGRRITVQWGKAPRFITSDLVTLPRPKIGSADEIAYLTRAALHEVGHAEESDLDAHKTLSSAEFNVYNALEDPRMERAQVKKFAGGALILNRGLDGIFGSLEKRLQSEEGLDSDQRTLMNLVTRGYLRLAPHEALRARGPGIIRLLNANLSDQQLELLDQTIEALHGCEDSSQAVQLSKVFLSQWNALKEVSPPQDQSASETQDPGDDADKSDEETSNEANSNDESECENQSSNESSTEQQSDPQQADEVPSATGHDFGDDQSNDDDSASVEQSPESAAGESQGESDDRAPAQTQAQGDISNADGESSEGCNVETSPSSDPPLQSDGDASNEISSDEESTNETQQSSGSNGDEAEQTSPVGDAEDSPESKVSAGQSDVGNEEPILSGGQSRSNGFENCELEDMGTLIKHAYEDKFGPMEVDQDGSDGALEETQSSDGAVAALAKLLEEAAPEDDLDELMGKALDAVAASTHLPDIAGQDAADVQVTSGAAHGARDMKAQPQVPMVLTGVVGRLVRVFLKKMQDRRMRQTKLTNSGGRVVAGHAWRLGALGDTKIFRGRREAAGVSAAVEILLDRSGSMDSDIQMATSSAFACAQAFERISGVKTAVDLFPGKEIPARYGDEREFESVMTLQHFGQSTRQVAAKANEVVADGSTPMAEAIAAVVPKLMQQKVINRFILVISDGVPDVPWSAKREIELAQSFGIELIGIGIGSECQLEKFIPNSEKIEDVTGLPEAFEKLFATQIVERLAA